VQFYPHGRQSNGGIRDPVSQLGGGVFYFRSEKELAILLICNDIVPNTPDWYSGDNLKRTIEQAKISPEALPGKVIHSKII
jgi:hypothetical protein